VQDYESKQVAGWGLVLAGLFVGLGLALAVGFGVAGRAEAWAGVVPLVTAALVANFAVLRVTVTADEVRWSFGNGWVAKRVALADVRGAEVAHSAWYWGWGIRWTPRGWLWRSSGLDAVWLERRSGKPVGIGSPDPESLARAVRERLPAPGG